MLQDLSTRKVKGIGKENGGLYYLPATLKCDEDARRQKILMAQQCSSVEEMLWHNRLGHPSVKVLQHLFRNKHIYGSNECNRCVVCPLAKQNRLPFHMSVSKTLSNFDLIHMDVWGPYRIATHNGFKFFLIIVDDHSKCVGYTC